MAWYDRLFETLATGLLGALASSFVTQGMNAAFAPSPPSRNQQRRDLQMQADVYGQAAQPVRTPEQTQADKMAIEQSQARNATFTQLSNEYTAKQQAGPQTLWDPYEEKRVEDEARLTAYTRFGTNPSGQTEEFVKNRMNEYRMGKSGEAARAHEQSQSNLRAQMLPYSNVERPGSPAVASPPLQVAPLSRQPQQPFSMSPINLGAIAPSDDEAARKRREQEEAAGASFPGV